MDMRWDIRWWSFEWHSSLWDGDGYDSNDSNGQQFAIWREGGNEAKKREMQHHDCMSFLFQSWDETASFCFFHVWMCDCYFYGMPFLSAWLLSLQGWWWCSARWDHAMTLHRRLQTASLLAFTRHVMFSCCILWYVSFILKEVVVRIFMQWRVKTLQEEPEEDSIRSSMWDGVSWLKTMITVVSVDISSSTQRKFIQHHTVIPYSLPLSSSYFLSFYYLWYVSFSCVSERKDFFFFSEWKLPQKEHNDAGHRINIPSLIVLVGLSGHSWRTIPYSWVLMKDHCDANICKPLPVPLLFVMSLSKQMY